MAIAEDKAALRAAVRSRRRERADADRRVLALALAEQARPLLSGAPATVTAYLSMPAEPGTDALVDTVLAAGHALLLPRITGRDLVWVPYDRGTPLDRGPMGIREPQGPAVDGGRLAEATLMLLPGLAVDRIGRRLGQGGGFYDRTLLTVPDHGSGGPLRVIVLFDDEVVDEVPAEAHDQRVDAVLTPSGVTLLS